MLGDNCSLALLLEVADLQEEEDLRPPSETTSLGVGQQGSAGPPARAEGGGARAEEGGAAKTGARLLAFAAPVFDHAMAASCSGHQIEAHRPHRGLAVEEDKAGPDG